jgi:hypothetical protein
MIKNVFLGSPVGGFLHSFLKAYELYFIFGKKILETDTLILEADSALEDLASMALG